MPVNIGTRLDQLLTFLAGWPRRVLALLCLLGALISTLGSHGSAAAQPRTAVVVAARNLKPGMVLRAADLRTARWPSDDLPAAAVTGPAGILGERVAAAMTRGEPFTPARLLATDIVTALSAGQVASTLALAGAGQAAILQAGSTIDLFAATDSSVEVDGAQIGAAQTAAVAAGVRVLAVLPEPGSTEPGSTEPGTNPAAPLIVVATDRGTAARLAAHAAGSFLATLVRPP